MNLLKEINQLQKNDLRFGTDKYESGEQDREYIYRVLCHLTVNL